MTKQYVTIKYFAVILCLIRCQDNPMEERADISVNGVGSTTQRANKQLYLILCSKMYSKWNMNRHVRIKISVLFG